MYLFSTFIIRHRKGYLRCSTWFSLSLTTSSAMSCVKQNGLRLFHWVISSQSAFFSWILLLVLRRICLCSNYKLSWWSQGQVQPHPDPCALYYTFLVFSSLYVLNSSMSYVHTGWLFIIEFLLSLWRTGVLSVPFPVSLCLFVWWASGPWKQLLLTLQDYFEGHSAHFQFLPTQKLKLFLKNNIVENYNRLILALIIVLNVSLRCILNPKIYF